MTRDHHDDATPPCPIVAFGAARVAIDDAPALRKALGPPGAPKVAFSLLKHADEQTVLGLSAVLHAIVGHGLADHSFENWGVVAAPRFLGRVQGSAHIDRYRRLGAGSVSPLIIPHLSLHSMSGTISLALGARGTNFGAGGAADHLAEGLMAAWCARMDGVDGIWLVATGWDPEPTPDLEKKSATPATGFAAAMALTPGPVAGLAPIGWLRPSTATGPAISGLPALCDFLDAEPSARPRRWSCPFPGGAMELGIDAATPQRAARAG